ncbi:hypothetical protein VTK73DRAFT_6834 [Phialemonium thermophilum]|uniref:Uncharacterized protein n=1 Tax=Phialemonium thermophilum TaxID=223376 RepID=A0ABR3Y8D0_9PEZI
MVSEGAREPFDTMIPSFESSGTFPYLRTILKVSLPRRTLCYTWIYDLGGNREACGERGWRAAIGPWLASVCPPASPGLDHSSGCAERQREQ